jgi:hypothetical protein
MTKKAKKKALAKTKESKELFLNDSGLLWFLHVFKGRLILVLLENDMRISQMYRFMKGEYFKAEQVCFFQSQNRLFQIG